MCTPETVGGCDIVIVIDNGEDEKSECAFFLSNESGSHFDPVFSA